jgi:hypothetical protein
MRRPRNGYLRGKWSRCTYQVTYSGVVQLSIAIVNLCHWLTARRTIHYTVLSIASFAWQRFIGQEFDTHDPHDPHETSIYYSYTCASRLSAIPILDLSLGLDREKSNDQKNDFTNVVLFVRSRLTSRKILLVMKAKNVKVCAVCGINC